MGQQQTNYIQVFISFNIDFSSGLAINLSVLFQVIILIKSRFFTLLYQGTWVHTQKHCLGGIPRERSSKPASSFNLHWARSDRSLSSCVFRHLTRWSPGLLGLPAPRCITILGKECPTGSSKLQPVVIALCSVTCLPDKCLTLLSLSFAPRRAVGM